MHRIIKGILWLIVAAVVITSLGFLSNKPTAPATGNVNLNGSTFRLVSYKGTDVATTTKYTLTFNDTSLSAKICNAMNGKYVLEDGIITVSQMLSTLMYCTGPDNVMDIESTLASVLAAGATLSQDGSNLTLTGKKGEKFVYSVFMD